MSERRQFGFSLLEVLVAFAVLAISLGVLMQIFAGSLRNADISRDQAQAVILAQSLLAGAGVDAPLVPGETAGMVAERFAWRLRTSPYLGDTLSDAATTPVTSTHLELWEVSAVVKWGSEQSSDSRHITLTTLKLQSPEGG